MRTRQQREAHEQRMRERAEASRRVDEQIEAMRRMPNDERERLSEAGLVVVHDMLVRWHALRPLV